MAPARCDENTRFRTTPTKTNVEIGVRWGQDNKRKIIDILGIRVFLSLAPDLAKHLLREITKYAPGYQNGKVVKRMWKCHVENLLCDIQMM